MKKNLYLHLGYPKTATSTLQKYLFPNFKNTSFIGKPFKSKIIEKIFYKLYRQDSLFYKKLDNKNTLKKEINKYYKNVNLIFSDETILEAFNSKIIDKMVIMQRLKDIFSDYNIKVILVLRNQMSMLDSLYVYDRRKKNNYLSGQKWVDSIIRSLDKETYLTDNNLLGLLDYPQIISKFEKIFKSSNVKIFLYEELKENIESFFLKIGFYVKDEYEKNNIDYINMHENKRRGLLLMIYLSLQNIFNVKLIKYFVPLFIRRKTRNKKTNFLNYFEKKISRVGPKAKLNLTRQQYLYLHKYFTKKNQNLLKNGLDIKKFDYPI